MATRIKFQQNLDELKERLLVMAGMAEQAIQRSIEAYNTRDLSLCELVFRSEPAINRLEREIDQLALDLLAMEQPMAVDLRFILSVIRINADLERVGDQGVNIAVRVREHGGLCEYRSAGRYPEAGVAFVGDDSAGAAGVYRGGCGDGGDGVAPRRPGGRDE